MVSTTHEYDFVKNVKDIHCKIEEKYDKKKLKELKTIADSADKQLVNVLFKSLNGSSKQKVDYAYANKRIEGIEYERVYADGPANYQSLPRNIRNYIAKDLYDDVDIVNCFPNILVGLCEQYKIPIESCPLVRNRDNLQMLLDVDKDTLKEQFVKLIHSSDFHSEYELLNKINREIYTIVIPRFKELYPNIWDGVLELFGEGEYNLDGKFISRILQLHETDIVNNVMRPYFESKKYTIGAWMHDGFFLLKKKNNTKLEEHILECQKIVKEKSGLSLQIINKPMESKYFDVAEELGDFMVSDDVIVDDVFAADTLVRLAGDSMVYCNTFNTVFVFDELTGLWSDDLVHVEILVKKYAKQLVFKQINASGNFVTFNYAGDNGRRNKMISNLKSSCMRLGISYNSFREDTVHTEKGKFLFSNGFYDAVTDTFTPGFDPTIVFNGRINREFTRSFNQEIYDEIYKKFFRYPFDPDQLAEDLDKWFLSILYGIMTRTLPKIFVELLGKSNSGRSTIYDALSYVFGSYVGTANADNLMKVSDKSESEKRLKFMVLKNYLRLLYFPEGDSQEEDRNKANVKLDVTLINMLSGGDSFECRRLFANAMGAVKCYATLVIAMNDQVVLSKANQAFKNRLRAVKYNKDAKEGITEVTDTSFPIDTTLRTKFEHNEEYQTALFWIIMNARDYKVPTPTSMIECMDEVLTETNKAQDWALKTFEITKDPKDIFPSADLTKMAKAKGFSGSRIRDILGEMGCPKFINGRTNKKESFDVGTDMERRVDAIYGVKLQVQVE
jgi:hypothetical protein